MQILNETLKYIRKFTTSTILYVLVEYFVLCRMLPYAFHISFKLCKKRLVEETVLFIIEFAQSHTCFISTRTTRTLYGTLSPCLYRYEKEDKLNIRID